MLLLSFQAQQCHDEVTYTDGENNSNPINATGDPNLFLSISSGSAIQSGAITGNGGDFIQKIGDGTLSLTAANTISGMSVAGGILKIASGGHRFHRHCVCFPFAGRHGNVERGRSRLPLCLSPVS